MMDLVVKLKIMHKDDIKIIFWLSMILYLIFLVWKNKVCSDKINDIVDPNIRELNYNWSELNLGDSELECLFFEKIELLSNLTKLELVL